MSNFTAYNTRGNSSQFCLPGPIAACQDEAKASDENSRGAKQVAPGNLLALLSFQAGVLVTTLLEEGKGEQDDETLDAATDCEGECEPSIVIEQTSNCGAEHTSNPKAGLTSSNCLSLVGWGHLRFQNKLYKKVKNKEGRDRNQLVCLQEP